VLRCLGRRFVARDSPGAGDAIAGLFGRSRISRSRIMVPLLVSSPGLARRHRPVRPNTAVRRSSRGAYSTTFEGTIFRRRGHADLSVANRVVKDTTGSVRRSPRARRPAGSSGSCPGEVLVSRRTTSSSAPSLSTSALGPLGAAFLDSAAGSRLTIVPLGKSNLFRCPRGGCLLGSVVGRLARERVAASARGCVGPWLLAETSASASRPPLVVYNGHARRDPRRPLPLRARSERPGSLCCLRRVAPLLARGPARAQPQT